MKAPSWVSPAMMLVQVMLRMLHLKGIPANPSQMAQETHVRKHLLIKAAYVHFDPGHGLVVLGRDWPEEGLFSGMKTLTEHYRA